MKNTLFFSILLCALFSKAQGPQQLVTVPYNTWSSAKAKGWLYLPADYSTTTTKYPVVIYYHGLGEAGTDPNLLLNNGLPKLIANGMRPDNITNPVDGKKYSFIVLSLQHWSWSPDPAWLPYNLDWLNKNYRIDTNRVYVTGMSAGGQQSFRAASNNDNVSRLVAAAVSMSPANVSDYDPMRIEQNKIETWFFSGNTDGGYTVNATRYSTECNTAYPGSSKLNIYSGGHCCWNTFYNTSWRDQTTGRSIWEFMLMNTRDEPKPLPVNFISVNIYKQDVGVKVTWKVGQEENVSHYEIEKSADGKIFSRTGTVDATSSDLYSYHDESLPSNYYRIKSVDVDGKYKYSMVAMYKQPRSGMMLKAFPVPARNELTLQHPMADNGSQIFIHAADGSKLQTCQANYGSQQTAVDLSRLKPGSYFIRYQSGKENSETLAITKQ